MNLLQNKTEMKTIEGFRLRDVMGQSTLVGEGVEQVNFNKLITFNASAAYLWQMIENIEFTVDDLATLLVERYEITADRALNDAVRIVEEWKTSGVVK